MRSIFHSPWQKIESDQLVDQAKMMSPCRSVKHGKFPKRKRKIIYDIIEKDNKIK
jgi:hypothetical protein